MNKKQKLVNKKHRRNKERLKELKKASISLSSKKVEKLVSNSAVKKPAAKKPAVKKPAVKKEISKKVSDILKTIKPIDIDNYKTHRNTSPRATIPMPDLTKRRDPDMDKGLGSLPRKFPVKPTLI